MMIIVINVKSVAFTVATLNTNNIELYSSHEKSGLVKVLNWLLILSTLILQIFLEIIKYYFLIHNARGWQLIVKSIPTTKSECR